MNLDVIDAGQINEALVRQVRGLETERDFYKARAAHLELRVALASARADRCQQSLREHCDRAAGITGDTSSYLVELRTLVREELALAERLRARAS